MEKPSMKKTGISLINWKRLAMFGVPLLLLAVLAVGGIFVATGAHAAAPGMNDHAPKPAASKDNNAPKPGAPKNVTVTGTIIKIEDSNTLIIRNFQGRGQTMVHIDRNTKFVSKGMGRKNSWRDLKVGDFIQATGPRNKDRDNSIQAKQIVVSKAPKHS
jgi:hypothetical protein